jgi:hypothetical protein
MADHSVSFERKSKISEKILNLKPSFLPQLINLIYEEKDLKDSELTLDLDLLPTEVLLKIESFFK